MKASRIIKSEKYTALPHQFNRLISFKIREMRNDAVYYFLSLFLSFSSASIPLLYRLFLSAAGTRY